MPTAAENYEGRPVIVYESTPGDIGTFAKTIAQHFGKSIIVEGWKMHSPITENALHLSNDAALKRSVCLTRKGSLPAYVFKFDDLFDQVQTFAQGAQA